jgi:hypothetical protein
MEHLQLADMAAVAAASSQNAATIYVRGTESLCMIQAASWLAMMAPQQHAADPLAGTVVGLQQASGQLELLLVRSSSPAVDETGEHIDRVVSVFAILPAARSAQQHLAGVLQDS